MSIASILIAAGTSDCETLNASGLNQPVNAISSLAFTVAGVAILVWAGAVSGHERLLRIMFGTAMTLTGVGSFLFHGYDGPFVQFSHDITFLVTIWMLAVINVAEAREWDRPVGWGIVGIGAAIFTVALLIGPGITNVVTVVVLIALVVSDLALERIGGIARPLWIASLVAMVLAVVFFALGRTGSFACDPTSWFQGHGLWHAFSAVALSLYFVATSRSRLLRSESR